MPQSIPPLLRWPGDCDNCSGNRKQETGLGHEGEVEVVLAIHIGTRWDVTRKVMLESGSKEGE